jgi:Cdc6-like AAA superfamily ATPase
MKRQVKSESVSYSEVCNRVVDFLVEFENTHNQRNKDSVNPMCDPVDAVCRSVSVESLSRGQPAILAPEVDGNDSEPTCIFIFGPSGAGKTRAVETMWRSLNADRLDGGTR